MIHVRRFGHATYTAPDVIKQAEYYKDVIGLHPLVMTPERAVLASRMGEEAIVIERGPEVRCKGIALQVDPETEFGKIQETLGIPGEYRSDTTPGISRSFLLTDPVGIEVELFKSPKLSSPPAVGGAAPMRAAHISFSVPDCKKAMEFYVEHFGFRVSDWMGDFFVFLRCSPDHHSINFHSHQNMTKAHVHHYAFEFKDWAHIQAGCEVLGKQKRQIIWGPGRHGIGHGIFVYHRDPDDNIVEFFTEIDQLKDESLGFFEPRPWHEDFPQRPKSWTPDKAALIWGAPPSPDFLRGGNPKPAPTPEMAEPAGRDRYLTR